MKAILLIMSVLAIFFVNIIFGVLMFILVALFVKDQTMIKAEVVFIGNKITINGFSIEKTFLTWNVFALETWIDDFLTLEEAIAYCLEN